MIFCKSLRNVAKKLTIPQNFLQSLTVLGGSSHLIASHLSFIGVIDGLSLYILSSLQTRLQPLPVQTQEHNF